jgi:hypothetical protein
MSAAVARAQFDALARIEPQLLFLAREINQVRATDRRERPERFCANRVWYGDCYRSGFKDRLRHLVGWHAEIPELRTMEAYDQAYGYLYERLPNCRNCWCL